VDVCCVLGRCKVGLNNACPWLCPVQHAYITCDAWALTALQPACSCSCVIIRWSQPSCGACRHGAADDQPNNASKRAAHSMWSFAAEDNAAAVHANACCSRQLSTVDCFTGSRPHQQR
jgi:hypothetical protein